MFLVVDHNKSKHADKYRLFEKVEEAVQAFNNSGYLTYSMGMPLDLRVGMMNYLDAGEECHIGLINLEVK